MCFIKHLGTTTASVIKTGDTSQHTTCLAKAGSIHVENVDLPANV